VSLSLPTTHGRQKVQFNRLAWWNTPEPYAGLRDIAARRGGWQHDDVDYVLAQVNVARMREPLDSPLLADFAAALDPVNAAADAAPGFIWRLQGEGGNATSVQAFEWDQPGSAGVLVNMSVWESVEALAAYVYSDTHREVLRRRRQWFTRMAEAYVALWWIPRGHIPTTGEAEERILYLRDFGPGPYVFTLKEHFPPPDVAAPGPIRSPKEWTCPA
jgi:Domain of unknown function (DUF3291)